MAKSTERGAVRMGPISILSLAIIICLAVMAVLAMATARANYNESQRQADYVKSAYSNEFVGQQFLATVDAVLARTAAEGGTVADAMATMQEELPSATAITERSVSLAFMTADGRTLVVVLSINDDLTYNIEQWKTVTQWEPKSTGGQLWSGE